MTERSKVKLTDEVRRILALPRRSTDDAAAGDALAAQLTGLLSVSGRCTGTVDERGICHLIDPATGIDLCGSPTRLRRAQAWALHDIGTQDGALLPIGVGEGKTLIFWLAAFVLGSQCVLGLLPASLIKNAEDARAQLSKHWLIPNHVRLMSYELLGRAQSASILDDEKYQPDTILCDEVHRLKNLGGAACARRIARYFAAHPKTRFVGMSGTIMRTSILEFWHLLVWALKGGSPVPMNAVELDEWALALDEMKVGAPGTEYREVEPGALLEFCNEEEKKHPPQQAARLGFRRRLIETPGIVAAAGEGEDVGASIYVKSHTYDVSAITDEHFHKLRGENTKEGRLEYPGWERPDGKCFEQGVEAWACARQLALGFHYEWEPPPPAAWMEARKAWSKFVRGVLSRSRTYDSPEVVIRAMDNEGVFREGRALLDAWREEKARPFNEDGSPFRPNTIAVWHDESALDWCAKWAKDGGIIWTEHHFFAQRLAKETGLSYFGPKGFDAKGLYIEKSRAKTIIASIDANRDGKNLQTQGWERMLFVSPPDGWDAWQQAIARIHRPLFRGDEVAVDFLLGCREHWSAWTKAMAGTEAARDTVGAKPKLLLADLRGVHGAIDVASFDGWRWR